MKNNKKETFWAYLCSAPSLLLILLIVVFPILYTAYISFTRLESPMVHHKLPQDGYLVAILFNDCHFALMLFLWPLTFAQISGFSIF